jgi:hypothetical protein
MRITLLLLLLAWSGAAPAETVATCKGYIDALPATIDTGGTWCLDHDLGTGIASGSAIRIAANNVVLDCNGFRIGGLAAGPATATTGIISTDTLNTVVRNCNIRGFRFGIGMTGGGGRLIERNRVEGSTLAGILLQGDGSVIRDNQVLDTGGVGTAAIGIATYENVDVLDNTIANVAPALSGTPQAYVSPSARGIAVATGDGLIARNIIRGVVSGGGSTEAISIGSSAGRVTTRENELMGLASETTSYGIRCQNGESPAIMVGNTLLGFADPWVACVDGGGNVEVLP